MAARTYRGTPFNLSRLAAILRSGGLVAVPTETVYGLAGDATSASACRKIFAVKGRPLTDPLIVHVADMAGFEQVCFPNEAAVRLARKFWPGPLTIILPKKACIPGEATAGMPSVAVRMPSHPLFRRLIRLSRRPLAAPSANPFGYVSPTRAEHVRDNLGSRISHILDGGLSRIGLESTIIDLRNPNRPRLLRPGAVTKAQLAKALGRRIGVPRKSGAPNKAQVAPGQLSRHYSPRTPVVLHRKITPKMMAGADPRDGWLLMRRPVGIPGPNVFWLDERGNSEGAARRLFSRLRILDKKGFLRIHAELAQAGGLGDAVNDRLRRAAARG